MKKRISCKTYSLAYLLSKQPKSLKKNRHYKEILFHLQSSEELKSLRINRRCYSLLDRAVIKPENLKHFYRTYKLPKNPFFPLFFTVKADYLLHRQKLKNTREKYIKEKVLSYPLIVQKTFKKIIRLEKKYNIRKRSPFCDRVFIPSTKKETDRRADFLISHWVGFFQEIIKKLKNIYKRIPLKNADLIIACFILEIDIDKKNNGIELLVKKSYRKLSKAYHPDLGGDSESFKLLEWAKQKALNRMKN